MAVVNLDTEEVFGCEPGSRVYLHEQGHIIFNKTSFGIKLNYYGSFFQMIAVFILSMSMIIDWLPLKLFGLTNALGMIVCYIYEEAWAWGWALKNYKE
jgi:hypothetical protein